MKPLHGIPEYVVTDHKNTSQAALGYLHCLLERYHIKNAALTISVSNIR